MNKNILIAMLVFVLGIFGGIIITKNDDSSQNVSTTQESNQQDNKPTDNQSASEVNNLIDFSLPAGYEEATCDASSAIYIVKSDTEAECGDNPDNALTLTIDKQNTDDCNELQNRNEVKKHICKSLFINDQFSLQSTTEYLSSSSFGKDITSQEYYIDTGKGVVKAQYLYTGAGKDFQAFESIVRSVRAK